MQRLWNVFLLPRLTYASEVWYQDYSYVNEKLLNVWRRFWTLDPTKQGPPSGVLNPKQYIRYKDLMFVHTTFTGGNFLSFEEMFTTNLEHKTRSLNLSDVQTPNWTLESRQKSIRSRVIGDWNFFNLMERTMKKWHFRRRAIKFVQEKYQDHWEPYVYWWNRNQLPEDPNEV